MSRSRSVMGSLVLVGAAAAVVGLVGLLGAAPPTKPAAPAATVDASKYPSLQAAFDAVPEAGGLVKLPPGTFELAQPLVLSTQDTRVEGSGTATHLINRNEKGEPALILRPKGYPQNRRARAWRVQLANFRVSGNPKSGDGVLAENIDELFIHGLAVDHNGGNGITLVNCYEDARVSNSIITYNKLTGLNILAGHDVVVSSNQFEENHDALRFINGFNLCMTGNCLDDHLGHGVVIENTYGSVVSGNMIEECHGTAIVLDRNCYGIALSANVIAHDAGGGIDLRDAWGCTVSANSFPICPKFGLRIGPKSGRIAVSGNSFCNTHIGGTLRRLAPGQDVARGIVLNATTDITITGNTFTGLGESAVKANGDCKRIVLSANAMADCSRDAPGKHPTLDLGKAEVTAGHNVVHEAPKAKK